MGDRAALDAIFKDAVDREAAARKHGAYCAQFIEGTVAEAEPRCAAGVTAEQRTEIDVYLDAYYAERTPVERTGNAEADKVIARLAGYRDAICNCTDAACAEREHERFDSDLGPPLPRDTPGAGRALASRLIDDISRCASDARFTRP